MRHLTLSLAAAWIFALAGCIEQGDTDGDGDEEIVISDECTWYAGATCEAECELTDFDFYCEGGCNGNIDLPECQINCEGSCQAECDLDPGSFSCEGYCGGECGASCEGDCQASSDQTACQGECEAYCEGECAASCQGTSPDVDCEGGCAASCEGGCSGGDLDFSCYFDCQIESPIDCAGSCDAEGFFECNGEFISSDDLESAIDWIEQNTDFEITYEGSADCSGNSCEASGSASFNCAAAVPGGQGPGGLLAAIASLF